MTTNDRSSSTIDNSIDEDALNQTTSKLRTFWGGKRNAVHLDKARLTKDSCQSNVTFFIFIISLSIGWFFFDIDIK